MYIYMYTRGYIIMYICKVVKYLPYLHIYIYIYMHAFIHCLCAYYICIYICCLLNIANMWNILPVATGVHAYSPIFIYFLAFLLIYDCPFSLLSALRDENGVFLFPQILHEYFLNHILELDPL